MSRTRSRGACPRGTVGLRIPLVYNCGGYESVETLRLLNGLIDIYMPDAKWSDSGVAEKYAQAPDYPAAVKEGLMEMNRQVGDLQISKVGVAERGLTHPPSGNA